MTEGRGGRSHRPGGAALDQRSGPFAQGTAPVAQGVELRGQLSLQTAAPARELDAAGGSLTPKRSAKEFASERETRRRPT